MIDLTAADKDAVSAMVRLRNNPDFIAYQVWLAKQLDAQRRQNDQLTGDHLKWSQGQCQAMQAILDVPDVAVKILKNSR